MTDSTEAVQEVTLAQNAEASSALTQDTINLCNAALAGNVSVSDVVASLEFVKFMYQCRAVGLLNE